MRFYTFLLMLPLVINTGCEKEKELLVADYVVRYIADTNELNAKAKFKTIIKEQSETPYMPSEGVTVLSTAMKLKSGAGITDDYYEIKKRTAFENNLKFKFAHPEGAVVEQSVPFEPLKGVTVQNQIIEKEKGFTVNWQEGEMLNSEELTIIIDNGKQKPLTLTKVGMTASDSFSVRKEQISRLEKGEARVTFLQRRYERYPKDGLVVGSYSVEYYHPVVKVMVE